MKTPTDLTDLNRILLNLARSRDFPDGSSRHGYHFIAPLDPEGHIDPVLWKKYRDYCRVRRFWAGEDDEIGISCTNPVAQSTHAGFSNTIPSRMMTMKPVTGSAHMPFCRASMFRSADKTASSTHFA